MRSSTSAPPTPTPATTGIKGSLTFVNGKFSAGSATLTLLNGIVIGPGVMLNKFGGTFGTQPDLKIGGSIGIGLVKVGQIDGNFLYIRRSDGVKAVHVDGAYSILGQPLASATFDYQSNGYTAFAGMFAYKTPPIDVIGNVNAWFEGKPDGTRRFQIEGQVSVRVWVIEGTAKAVINTDWIAACGQVEVFAKLTEFLKRPPVYVSGYAAYNRNSGKIEGFFGCDLASYKIAPSIAPASAAQAGDTLRFAVAPGQKAIGLTVPQMGGAPPVVRLHGPGGRPSRHAPADERGRPGRRLHRGTRPDGNHTTSAPTARGRHLARSSRSPGSAAVTAVLMAQPLPSQPVGRRSWDTGRTCTLEYRFDRPDGGAVRFVERGRDVNRVLGAATQRSGRIRFTAADGRGGRAASRRRSRARRRRALGHDRRPLQPRPVRAVPAGRDVCGSPQSGDVVSRGRRPRPSDRLRDPGARQRRSPPAATHERPGRAGAGEARPAERAPDRQRPRRHPPDGRTGGRARSCCGAADGRRQPRRRNFARDPLKYGIWRPTPTRIASRSCSIVTRPSCCATAFAAQRMRRSRRTSSPSCSSRPGAAAPTCARTPMRCHG